MALVNFEAFINRYKSEDRAATSSSSSSSSASLPPSPSPAISFFSTGLRKDNTCTHKASFLLQRKTEDPKKRSRRSQNINPGT